MAAALVVTVGGTTSNSYCSAAEFTTWSETRQPSTAYDDATADERIRALITATRRLDQAAWKGVRVNETQALQWPRYGVEKPDIAYSVLEGAVFTESTWYDTDEIPQRVKNAQMETAYQILAGGITPDNTGMEGFENVKVGPLDITPNKARKAGVLTDDVLREIGPLLRVTAGGVRLHRG